MKFISLLSLIALNCGFSFAQEAGRTVTEESKKAAVPATVNSNVYNNSNMEINNGIVLDTTIYLKKEKAKSLQKNISSESEKADTESVSSSSLFKSNANNYQSVYQQSTHNKSSRSATPVQQKQMNSSLGYMNTLAPTAFETNLFSYVNGRYDSDSSKYLLKAAELEPNDPLVRKQLSAYYLIEEQPILADSVTQTLFTDGTYCQGMTWYATDLSNSVPATNTVIVHGIDDLLPLTQVQTLAQVQADGNATFEIVSLELLQSKEYRKSLEKLGYNIPDSKIVDTAFLVDFVQMNPEKNIQLSMTLPKEYLERFMPNLYPMGLTFVLEKSDDLNTFNAQLWENEWNREHLINGTGDWSDNLTKNYLPSLYTLQKYYQTAGKTDEVAKIQQVIDAISARNGVKPKGKMVSSSKKGG